MTIRGAGPGDADALRRLAELDGDRLPLSPVLIAELDGNAIAAMSLSERRVIADPFRRTEHARRMLFEQADWQERSAAEAERRLGRGLQRRSAPWPA
ncbi:MAG TPA: hypothetical protein VKA36_09695 [Solirubrobacterales bacterium]|nr:hypothetical protein [Solirubrobacterales bacterium]